MFSDLTTDKKSLKTIILYAHCKKYLILKNKTKKVKIKGIRTPYFLPQMKE